MSFVYFVGLTYDSYVDGEHHGVNHVFCIIRGSFAVLS